MNSPHTLVDERMIGPICAGASAMLLGGVIGAALMEQHMLNKFHETVTFTDPSFGNKYSVPRHVYDEYIHEAYTKMPTAETYDRRAKEVVSLDLPGWMALQEVGLIDIATKAAERARKAKEAN